MTNGIAAIIAYTASVLFGIIAYKLTKPALNKDDTQWLKRFVIITLLIFGILYILLATGVII